MAMVKAKLIFIAALLMLVGCQTVEVAKEEKPAEQYCGPSAATYRDGLHTILMAANEDIYFRDLSETDHLVFLSSYNRTPPPSNIKADRIRFYYKLGARQVFMVMTMQNCVSQAGQLSVHQLEAWLQGIVIDPGQLLDKETKI